MSNAKMTLAEELAALKAENAQLKARAEAKVTIKVAQGGGLSVYGMGRFPVTLFQEQWLKLLGMSETIVGYISAHQDTLVLKNDDEPTLAAKAAARKAQGFVSKEAREAAATEAATVKVTYAKPPAVTRHAPR